MSNRTLIELNHDHCPRNAEQALQLGLALMAYMRAADPAELPQGVRFKHFRHHTDPDPMADRAQAEGPFAALRR